MKSFAIIVVVFLALTLGSSEAGHKKQKTKAHEENEDGVQSPGGSHPQGPQGPQGPQAPQGQPGPQGPQGLEGSNNWPTPASVLNFDIPDIFTQSAGGNGNSEGNSDSDGTSEAGNSGKHHGKSHHKVRRN